ncbi:diaminopimelate epimerase [Georgenia sp. TF02-10]|uniref:diaminopimelate epimerase n=1 Tax=Georgenia sp. TF02-10 TaxID=2917725 RepID=UPI001FA7AC7E|nr:diaminopimelate epimerase [Georgenia sp. TF02-10]UNX55953.1 diaminopimelate epimerase [Georgenia sp. TF02-10]
MTSPFGALAGRGLTTGHGTENDFLLVPDPDGELDLTAAEVAAACDRHAGVGADGLIRVVRTAALTGADQAASAPADPAAPAPVDPAGAAPAPADAPAPAAVAGAEWFMDYRNADGSVAEMCGNGIRVFVHYLREQGLVDLPPGASIAVGTRGGIRQVAFDGERYTVAMGRWAMPGGLAAVQAGYDVIVQVPGLPGPRAGLRVTLPNPHTVVALPDEAALAAADLTGAVAYDPVPPAGTNLELVVPLGDDDAGLGTVRMRVLERGVGETRSCGTGTCAAALAVRAWGGPGAPDTWRVLVPGGEVLVHVDGDQVTLTGPAVLTADVTLR